MTAVLQYAVLGLGTGAIYALLAQGIVTVYRGSGVLNFSHGAIAMVGAFLFFQLHGERGWAFGPAFAVVVLGGALLGAAIYRVVMQPLGGASSLSREIASLGVLLVLQAGAVKLWGSNAEFVDPSLPDAIFDVAGVAIGTDRLILVGLAGGVTVGLYAFYKWAKAGLATVAVAENRRAAAAAGWSPDLLATLNWALGSALAAVAGVLIAPITGIQPEAMTMLVIPALAAALVGGFVSFPLTLAGGIAIGVAQSLIAGYVDQQGAADSFPFAVIVLLLVVRGKGLPVRGHIGDRFAKLGSGEVNPRVVVPLVAAVAVGILVVFPVALLDALTVSFAVALIMLSIVVLTGYTGQLSLAQFALGGLGAFFAAKLVASVGLPFELALVAAVAATVPVGLAFGLPALRTRGVNLAVVTLGLGLAVQSMIFKNATLTGGSDGTPVGIQSLFGISIDAVAYPERYALVVFAAFVVCALAVTRVRRGRSGRRLIAVRTNERAAAALGISVFGAKLYAFALAAALAGLGGVLLGFQDQVVVYDPYGPLQSILGVAYTVVGSIGWIAGPLFGSTLYHGGLGSWIFHSLFSGEIETFLPLIGGVALLLFLIADPNGMASSHARMFDPLARALRRLAPARRNRREQVAPRASAAVPAPVTTSERRVRPARLAVEGITVRFGAVVAVDDVSLTVEPGQVVGLIGPNGAGKTTLIDAITGFVRTDGGTVALDERPIDRWPVHRRARAGLSRSFQSLELFDDVTVRDNLRAASDDRDRRSYLTNLVVAGNEPLPPAAVAAIAEFALEQDLDRLPDELPYGRRRLTAVARAVAAEPSILLLDEPAAGLDERESAELAELVRRLADRWGIGIVLVEHDMAFVMKVCDRITVLDFGRQIAEGTPEQVRSHPAVIAAYLGEPTVTAQGDGGSAASVVGTQGGERA